MHFYVYYSYEEYGRGYIGQRQCKCLPEKDVNYFGSFHDKTSKKFYFCEKRSEETKRKISETKKNQPHKGGWPKGKKHSPEVIERCRLAALAQHRNKSK
jgi:hypothetical protein